MFVKISMGSYELNFYYRNEIILSVTDYRRTTILRLAFFYFLSPLFSAAHKIRNINFYFCIIEEKKSFTAKGKHLDKKANSI